MKTKVVFLIAFLALVWKIQQINPQWLSLKQTGVVNELAHPFDSFLPIVVTEIDGQQTPTFQYRGGPERRGVASQRLKLPLKPSWQSRRVNYFIHGASKGSAAVDDFGVIVPADSGWLYSYDLQGKMQWKFYVAESPRGIHATPTLTKDYVFFGAYNGNFYALHRQSGLPAWVTEVGQTVGASSFKDGPYLYVSVELTASPLNGYMVKLDSRNGQVIWRSEFFGEQSHSSPTLATGSGLVLAGANNQTFFAVDKDSGEVAWRYPAKGHIKGTAAFADDRVYFTDWGGNLTALHAPSASHIWSRQLGAKSQSSPTLIKEADMVVVATAAQKIYGIAMSSGEIRWQIETHSERDMGSATAFQEQGSGQWLVAVSCTAKDLCLIEVATGKIRQKLPVGGKITSVPTIFGGRIYVTIDSNNLQVFESS